MEITKDNFSKDLESTLSETKHFLTKLSLKVRRHQLDIMIKRFKPGADTKVLDVGFCGVELLADTNFFEKFYPYKSQIVAASVEECSEISKKYPEIKIDRIKQGEPLPYKDNEFDIVTSWATLEHVGPREDQDFFLSELARVGKKVFLTVPARNCFYEPHTGLFFLHWLPIKWFQKSCKMLDKEEWSNIYNLNPTSTFDLKKMKSFKNFKILKYRMYDILFSHIILVKDS